MKEPLHLIPWDDPRLEMPSKRVEKVTAEVLDFAQDLKELMVKEKGVGIAAPQVGHNIRIIVVDLSPKWDGSQLTVLINPIVHRVSQEKTVFQEGCLSFPGLFVKLERHDRVAVKAWDEKGDEITVEADFPVSICLQHEIDHLDGITFVKRLDYNQRKALIEYWRKDQSRGTSE